MEQFIPPELRQHTAAIKAGFKVIQDGMKLSDPKDITKYSKKFIGIAKDGIKTGKILPSLVGVANVANSIMFSAMDMLGPLGGGAKTLVKTPVKVLDNAFKEVGGTLKYSKNKFDPKRVENPGAGSGMPGVGTGKGPSLRETEISNKRKYVDEKLKEIYDNAPKDKDGLPKLSTNWATSKETKKQIYDSDPNMFPEWKDGIGSWNDLGSGFLAGKFTKVRGKRINTGDQVTSVKLPVSETKAPYKQAEIDFNTAVSKKLNVDSLKPQDQTLKYLNFIRLSESDELLKNSDKFFKKYNFDDLNIPGTKLNENFEKFKILDNKRIALRDDPAMQSLMRKIFPDTEIKFDIAHTFESGQIRKGKVSKSKQGKGGDADEMY